MIQGPGARPQRGRYSFEVVQRETPSASGFTIVCHNETTTLLIDPPTSALGSGSVVLPAAMGDGDVLKVIASKSIVALTYSAANGATIVNPPGALGVGGKHEFVFNAATRSFYCLSSYRGIIFNQPKIANLTWVNQGSCTATDGPTALEIVAPAQGSINIALLITPIPAFPFSCAMKFSWGNMEWGSGNPGVGLCVYNSVNGRFFEASSLAQTSGAGLFYMRHWTAAAGGSAGNNLLTNSLAPPHAIRMDCTSTAAAVYNGDDGFSWRSSGIASETFSAFVGTPTHFGLMFNPTNNWGTYQIESLGYWV